MKKGSKAIRCYECGQVVGWEIPTGEYAYGIPKVTVQMKSNGREVWKGGSLYYFCYTCKPKED